MSNQKSFREAPPWLTEEAFIESLLSDLLNKLDHGKKARLKVRKGARLFAPLYEFKDQEAKYLWSLILTLEHDYKILDLVAPKKQPQHWDTEYEGVGIFLSPDGEKLLRHWLKRPAFDPYQLTWQESINKHQPLVEENLDQLLNNPIEISGRSAKEVVQAIAKVFDYSKNGAQLQPLALRELSARCFWGNSKYLEKHKAFLETYFPSLRSKLQKRPLLVEVHLPAGFSHIVFIENQDTFLRACRGELAALKDKGLVYSAGFKASSQKGRQQGDAVFAYVNTCQLVGNNAAREFEQWWFGESDEKQFPCYFWGDLDLAGMAILASLRRQFSTIQAWEPGYQVMLAAVLQGGGHTACEAAKNEQCAPRLTGCEYADEVLLPSLRKYQRFVDQEWFLDEE